MTQPGCYELITREHFEKALPGKARLSEEKTRHAGELIYEIPLNGVSVFIYSSISKTGLSRGVGEDAIRVVLVDNVSGKAVGSKRVYRVPGWSQRMRERIVWFTANKNRVKRCPRCNAVMIKRTGKYGDFYGCLNFPQCKHTEKI